MNLGRVSLIFAKDLRSGIRNAQILIALAVPVCLGLAYNAVLPDTTKLPTVTLAYSAPSTSRLPAVVRTVTAKSARVQIEHVATAADVRKEVDKGRAKLGLVIPAGFDQALRTAGAPRITVVLRDGADTTTQYVAAAVDPAARHLAATNPLLFIETQVLPGPKASVTQLYDEVGVRSYGVLGAIILLLAMISVYVVPLMLTEESEKKTLDALAMIASYAEIISAKALVGLAYAAAAVPIMLVMTRLKPADVLRFGLGMGLLAVTLVGVGLLLGELFRTSTQVNTWSTFLLLPIILGALLVGYDVPRAVEVVMAMMPSTHAMQLATEGLSGNAYFGNPLISVTVLLAWGVAVYGLLWWRLQRREA